MIAPSRLRRPTWRQLAIVAALSAALSTAACGDDDDAESSDSSETTAARPTTTEPDTTDPDDIESDIQELLHSYDEVLNEIVSDPEVASNPDHPLYGDLRDLMAPGSEMTDALVDVLSQRADQGVYQLPYEDGDLTSERTVDGEVEMVSDTEVRFPICTLRNYRTFTGDQQMGFSHDRAEAGRGSAVRVSGAWRLNRLENLEEMTSCGEEGQ